MAEDEHRTPPHFSSSEDSGRLKLLMWAWKTLHLFGSRWALRGAQLIPTRVLPQGKCVYYYSVSEPVVALTIDDCPGLDSESSFEVLDLLKSHGAKATFFVISENAVGQDAVMAKMISDGHELANHMCVDEPCHRYSAEQFESRLLECESVIEKFDPGFASRSIKWFRPPCGALSESMLANASRHGYSTVLGDVFPLDVLLGAYTDFISDFTVNQSKPGSVIVIHFPSKIFRNHNFEVLRRLLPELTARFNCITLTDLRKLSELVAN